MLNKDCFEKNNSYQLVNKTYYEVILKPNIYFSNDKITSNNYYIANSIKSIDVYFNYYLKNYANENINYSYDITVTLKSYADNGTKLIWTKDFNLESNKNIYQKELVINKVYNLDYQYYVNYVKSFQEYYDIKTETYLEVKLNINLDNTDKPYVLLTIPINKNIIEITMDEVNNILNNDNKNNDFNKSGIFLIIIIATIILIIKNNIKQNNEYTLLKNNKDIIITILNDPFINNNKIIYLTNLKDLINMAINYNLNIFNYHNNYYIIKDNIYYIYILNN